MNTLTMDAPRKRRWRDWTYFDLPLFFFVGIMVAAASITSHGTYVFYSYILPMELAVAATVVLTAGIPLLELASVLDKKINKEGKEVTQARYLFGLIFLLLLEALAQYFQGQAGFVGSIKAQWAAPAGVDLATFAIESRGRLLPMLYLAALSGVVVYFGYAASARIRDLRKKAKRLDESVVTPEQHAALLKRIADSEADYAAAQSIVATLEAERDEARDLAISAHERAESLQARQLGDAELAELLASGQYDALRQVELLIEHKQLSQNQAADIVGIGAQNYLNWRDKREAKKKSTLSA